ncbi:hypothetical protein BP5796_02505 [Coleophoma crateriformis]|uniref:Uncharacterized protein n=1 Tax=Coleophoma crateriformis TaxID=565419 RepID=A0A3D8SYI8_9HELO|nr:hypothetical protein BP5796_02505 [Coleophoma crateriformis]
MASPLLDKPETMLNATPPTERHGTYDDKLTDAQSGAESDPASSPFNEHVTEENTHESLSPSKPPRPLSLMANRDENATPLKSFKSRPQSMIGRSSSPHMFPEAQMSPRKLSSPIRRFPVKPSISAPAPERRPSVVCNDITVDLEDALRDNEGLTKAIQILEDDSDDTRLEADDTLMSMEANREPEHEESANFDDTMASAYSDFSAVPDMTMFAKIGHSPSKFANASMGPTPRRGPAPAMTPATARRTMDYTSSTPTPRGHPARGNDTTNLILDFTDQINGFSGATHPTPSRHGRMSPMKNSMTMPDLASFHGPNTPSANRNQMSNLLDFDIPPAPTPRSMPSITPRELESLKSSFLSEISSLKASLSGKEAEVNSLKTAVGDAEKRVGESMEQAREERDLKEQVAAEKEEWEKRSKEMEAVLRNVKEEIVNGEHERDDLEGRLEESERRREMAEIMAQEAESKMAAMRAGKLPPTPSTPSPSTPTSEDKLGGECSCGGTTGNNRAVEVAVEKVSRELHTLYKDKHETKVSALKKSYERRWDKKVKELEDKVEDLTHENEELRRDVTMTKLDHKNLLDATEDISKQAAQDARARELEAELEGLSEVVKSVKHDNAELRHLLDEERVEKGKLVAAVDEMIPLVAAFDDMLADINNSPPPPTPERKSTPTKIAQPGDNLRRSISRTSGLRAPKSVSGIPAAGGFGHMRAPSGERSGSAQGSRPGSGLGRSGIMSSIERMGSYKGRGE